MSDLVEYIERIHNLPLRNRALTKHAIPPNDVINPIYEIENYLRDRNVLETPIHSGACCDNPNCLLGETEQGLISGLRYYCLDCTEQQTDFCSTCVALPGQAIDHDCTHRLLQLPATECAVCKGVTQLKVHPGDDFRGPYREFASSGAILRRIMESRSCGFCAFVFNALTTCPLEDITWPPKEDDKVTIRVRKLRSRWLEIAVKSDFSTKTEDIEVGGQQYTRTTQSVKDKEREFQVVANIKLSNEMDTNPLTSIEERFMPPSVAKVLKNSGSDEALQLAKTWFQYCTENHPACASSSTSSLPTRVIDVKGEKDTRVYLRKGGGEEGAYAALSYCWGPGGPGLITTQENYQRHQDDGIKIEDLPKTIQEAVHATRYLGIRYLWVDRLCIVQDSVEDWAHEAALMCAVFSSATLTLSADGSDSATKGLYQTDQAMSNFEYKRYIDLDGDKNALVLHIPQDHLNLSSRVSSMNQPVDQRGWTMQERLMSRRVLHFTSDEMIWECNTLVECECRRQSEFSNRDLSNYGRGKDDLNEHWRRLVKDYAKRSLAYESDKMLALCGLVERFQLLVGEVTGQTPPQDDDYLAGLWRGDLVAQLAWKLPSESDLNAFRRATNRRFVPTKVDETVPEDMLRWMEVIRERDKREDWHESGGYVAPTWSWAHIRGPFSYLFVFPRTPFISYVDVIEAKTVPVNPNEVTRKVSSGFITMQAHMVRGLRFDMTTVVYTGGAVDNMCWLSYDSGHHRVSIHFKPDDYSGLSRKWGSSIENVVVLLLGTKDFAPPPKGGKAIAIGVCPPMPMKAVEREKDNDDGAGQKKIEDIDALQKKDDDSDALQGQLEKLNFESSSLPQELTEAYRTDIEQARWSTYLVLAESREHKTKYERIGCFEVWGNEEKEVIGKLFWNSVREEITII